MRNSTRTICQIAIFVAIIAALAQISIPLPGGVPMTLQTFAVPLAGIILGAKKGTVATVVYVITGAIGIPVFAGFSGGAGEIFGKTGGFILSFPVMAFTAGLGAHLGRNSFCRKKHYLGYVWLVLGLILGAAINYLCGMVMFSFVTSLSFALAFIYCVLPFIPTSIIKIILAAILGVKCRNILQKRGLLT